VDTVELGLDADVPEGGLRFITLQEVGARVHAPLRPFYAWPDSYI
jgi:hypothetical protein